MPEVLVIPIRNGLAIRRRHSRLMTKILFVCHGSSKMYTAERGVIGQNAAVEQEADYHVMARRSKG